MRFYEAIFYNKILLTNNHSSMKHPLYNDKYMSVFDSEQEIDIKLIKSDNSVDYHYQNEMSPVYFVEEILNRE